MNQGLRQQLDASAACAAEFLHEVMLGREADENQIRVALALINYDDPYGCHGSDDPDEDTQGTPEDVEEPRLGRLFPFALGSSPIQVNVTGEYNSTDHVIFVDGVEVWRGSANDLAVAQAAIEKTCERIGWRLM